MKTPTKKIESGKCEFCSPESSPELCKLSTATSIIDGKEYSACCPKCAGGSAKEKPQKSTQNKAKNKQ
jgi:hypothetical protein